MKKLVAPMSAIALLIAILIALLMLSKYANEKTIDGYIAHNQALELSNFIKRNIDNENKLPLVLKAVYGLSFCESSPYLSIESSRNDYLIYLLNSSFSDSVKNTIRYNIFNDEDLLMSISNQLDDSSFYNSMLRQK